MKLKVASFWTHDGIEHTLDAVARVRIEPKRNHNAKEEEENRTN